MKPKSRNTLKYLAQSYFPKRILSNISGEIIVKVCPSVEAWEEIVVLVSVLDIFSNPPEEIKS